MDTVSLPRQVENIPSGRAARAPYNFVELPQRVIEAEAPPSQNVYHTGRHTGTLACVLTTASPLYTRGGLTPEQFAKEEESKNQPGFFSLDARTGRPVIPGSSLRGMLRTLVEIAGYGKIERVSDQEPLFFRAVASKNDDPLKGIYNLRRIQAGYLVEAKDGWHIRPARQEKYSQAAYAYIWVKEDDIQKARLAGYIPMRNIDAYRPQYLSITFDDAKPKKSGRCFAIGIRTTGGRYEGVLVTSGNMLETGDNPSNLKRRNHCIVLPPDAAASKLKIDDSAVKDYCAALTPFQKEAPFDDKVGVLKDGRPIFYCEPLPGQQVTLFGQSPNFRIPYTIRGRTQASTPRDFIPQKLNNPSTIDLADAIFGYVRNKSRDKDQATVKDQACAGRIFVGDAVCRSTATDDIWLTGGQAKSMRARVLSSPKPTTFQHYLVQQDVEKRTLKHYASDPGTETVIRGHKLYWHQSNVPKDKLEATAEEVNKNPDQHPIMTPIKAGVSFDFAIRFENLSDVELGALLWVLKVASDDSYRLSLGMGKPLGMGAVSVTHHLTLTNRYDRYIQLFDETNTAWQTADHPMASEEIAGYIRAFEGYVMKHIEASDSEAPFENLPRIKELLTTLRWPGPDARKTEYMKVKPNNEFAERKVLPTPLQVDGIPSEPAHPTHVPTSRGTSSPPSTPFAPSQPHLGQSPNIPTATSPGAARDTSDIARNASRSSASTDHKQRKMYEGQDITVNVVQVQTEGERLSRLMVASPTGDGKPLTVEMPIAVQMRYANGIAVGEKIKVRVEKVNPKTGEVLKVSKRS